MNKRIEGAASDDANMVNVVYILYLVALVFPVTALVGLIIAYVYRGNADWGPASHYTWQIRTFWIGLLISVIGSLTVFVAIGVVILLAGVVWWIVRCVRGLQWASRREAVPRPADWVFG